MRDKAGALQRGSLQARDRQEALQKIRALGGTPVNVTESSVPKTPFVWQPAWTRAAVGLGVAVVVIAGIVLWLQRPRTPPRPAPTPAPTPVTPSGADTSRPTDTPRPDVPIDPGTGVASPRVPATGPAPVTPSGSGGATSPDTAQAAPNAGEPREEVPPERPAPFKSITEQVLSIIASVPPGIEIPPMPEFHGMDKDFAKAATNTLVIFDNDSEELIHRLETVAWSKLEMGELVQQGWKADDVLKSLVDQHNEDANLRSAASLALKKMVDNGQLTAVTLKEELAVINDELSERGLPEITLPELGLTETP